MNHPDDPARELPAAGADADKPPGDAPGVLAPPPLLYAGTLLVGLGLHRLFPTPRLLPRVPAVAVGAVLLLFAGTLAVAAFRTMARARTAVNPYLPTTAIVTTGPFRFSRNPIYLSLTLLYLGLTLLLGASLWLLLLLAPFAGGHPPGRHPAGGTLPGEQVRRRVSPLPRAGASLGVKQSGGDFRARQSGTWRA